MSEKPMEAFFSSSLSNAKPYDILEVTHNVLQNRIFEGNLMLSPVHNHKIAILLITVTGPNYN